MANLSGVYSELKRASGAASRIYDIIDRPIVMPLSRAKADEFYEDAKGRKPGSFDGSRSGGVLVDWSKGSSHLVQYSFQPGLLTDIKFEKDIQFKNVTFSYPSRRSMGVLKDFCLSINAGDTVSIVGVSGSGKSTIGSLLGRLYEVDSGEILIDGINVRDVDPQKLRSMISLVNQESSLFGLSVFDNILYGNTDATYHDVVAAAKAANAHDFIMTFTSGYDTLVGERGLNLSGGQKQRIAIARALLKDAPIVILDEATSALDSESEALVNEAFQLLKNRTIITIAHRLSTIKSSNLVVVLGKNGRIEEMGSFDELYNSENDTMFRKLMRKQAYFVP